MFAATLTEILEGAGIWLLLCFGLFVLCVIAEGPGKPSRPNHYDFKEQK